MDVDHQTEKKIIARQLVLNVSLSRSEGNSSRSKSVWKENIIGVALLSQR